MAESGIGILSAILISQIQIPKRCQFEVWGLSLLRTSVV